MSTTGATPTSTTAEELVSLLKNLTPEEVARVPDLIREANEAGDNVGILALGAGTASCALSLLVVAIGLILGNDEVKSAGARAVGKNCS
jgi:hypothetical protein